MEALEGCVVCFREGPIGGEDRVVDVGGKESVHVRESTWGGTDRQEAPESGRHSNQRFHCLRTQRAVDDTDRPARYDRGMNVRGIIVKMPVSLENGEARYVLRLEQPRPEAGQPPAGYEEVAMNALVGRSVRIVHTGSYVCTRCGREVNKLFGEGMCYPCFRDAPEAAECIVRPELCEAHVGRGRDPQWEEEHHNQPHAVYLAVTSAVKVGVTRHTQIPTRWIDQGAAWAVQIAETPYRRLAGELEVSLKDLYTDRTAWQRMLKGETLAGVDLDAEMARIAEHVAADETRAFLKAPEELERITISYPIRNAPSKVRSLGLQKQPTIESTLEGIRGQYLLLEDGYVMNMRRHAGFVVEVEV